VHPHRQLQLAWRWVPSEVTCASKIIVILFRTSFWMGYIMCSLPYSNDMWRHDDAYNHIISLLGPTYLVKLKKSPSLDAWLFDDIVKVYVDCPPSLPSVQTFGSTCWWIKLNTPTVPMNKAYIFSKNSS
jgi:hypothetical protein